MKIRVVHTGSRDHYQLAASFAECSNLERLVTSGYYKKRPGLLRVLGGKERFSGRSSPLIPDHLVESHSFVDFAKALASKFNDYSGINIVAERMLGHLAAISSQDIDVLISYSYMAHTIFSKVECKKVLFQCHPNPAALRQEPFNGVDLSSTGFAMEREFSWGEAYRSELECEWKLADQIIVASSFVKKSLIMAGASDSKIHVNPYGCESVPDVEPRTLRYRSRKKLLFVGQLVWRKGADLLAEVAKTRKADCEIIVVTRGLFDKEIMKTLENLENVKVHVGISDIALKELYLDVDALLFPSRFEGYGLVINEALSYGLPVIASVNTAFADIHPSYRAGLLVEKVDLEAVSTSLDSLFVKENYECSSNAAIQFSEDNSWANFRRRNRGIVLGEHEHID